MFVSPSLNKVKGKVNTVRRKFEPNPVFATPSLRNVAGKVNSMRMVYESKNKKYSVVSNCNEKPSTSSEVDIHKKTIVNVVKPKKLFNNLKQRQPTTTKTTIFSSKDPKTDSGKRSPISQVSSRLENFKKIQQNRQNINKIAIKNKSTRNLEMNKSRTIIDSPLQPVKKLKMIFSPNSKSHEDKKKM